MDFIEEKTPGGNTIKVLLKTWEYTVFNKAGKVIYADEAEGKVLRKVPVLGFLGKNIRPVKTNLSEIIFYKISKGDIIIPYDDLLINKRKYLFLRTYEDIDVVPLRVIQVENIYRLVREIENGLIFDYTIVDKNITDNEIIVIKNRCPSAEIFYSEEGDEKEDNTSGNNEADDAFENKNLNIMSNNPVFLARIHLKKLALSKVNQILLDFDISSLEAEYMLRFIEVLLSNKEGDEEIEKNRTKLEAQADGFRFYISLINSDNNAIISMINDINDSGKISSYSTLLAKVKLLFSKQEDLLQLTEYENLLYEAKDRMQES
ncbi:MAG: hypothetical protein JW864_11910 [Spirochaetes bacterium]|nr:hypothetical protein [Spirochaetota bacterium]